MNQLINERNSLLKDIHTMVLKTTELVCQNLKDEDTVDLVDKLKRDVVAKYCKQEEVWKNSINVIDSNKATDEEIEKVFDAEMQKIPMKRPESNQLYKEFEEKVQVFLHPEDADLLETQSTINLIDPVTKKRMKDPVKNVVCNHTYDKISISALIKAKSSGSIRCPYQGCNNQTRFKLQDLVPDEITRKALMKRD
ncbi:E3 SUMO-protein ligase NSE2 [Nilaparvata lugens]|uniref:E3 SUMO-protein ligase NSE2 n=1 Tax=Nilaparvata lugens TaxID=108931 RepID=UPI000B9830AE|nr:E3 SUMO-protein ligase NSE2 [Nilaparvata lugens]